MQGCHYTEGDEDTQRGYNIWIQLFFTLLKMLSHRQYKLHLERAGWSKIVVTWSILGISNAQKFSCRRGCCLPDATLGNSFTLPLTTPLCCAFSVGIDGPHAPTPDTAQ